MLRFALGLSLAISLPALAAAQPFNVRAWYAQGQVFVVWQFPAPPAAPTDTVEIYASPAAQVNVAFMQQVGRLFFPEYTGSRLAQLQPNARLLIPTPAGGTYRLAIDEGVFVYTPHAAGNLFFAAVDTGAVVVNAGNSAATAFNYDPVNEPVRPHWQFAGATPGGYPYAAYVVWADGQDNYNNSRPDFPILANAAKNGVPHVFTITRPNNALPTTPLSCLLAIHGGEGEYELFRPGVAARANLALELTDGIVVTPDDSIFFNQLGAMVRMNTSWFGYVSNFDPFTALLRPAPPNDSIVVDYTARRVHWILDWLLSANSPHPIDRQRVAMIGHSGGGRGTSLLTRLRPERFAAAVVHTPASDLSVDDGGRDNPLRGNWDQNLETNVIGPAGLPLKSVELFTMTTRISSTLRDFALTRFFYGKRDEKDAASWSSTQRAVVDALNDAGVGYMVSWDEREHGVELWDNETNDATDAHAGPWPDVAQWIAPVRSERDTGQYLVDAYRADQSYPGQFNADADAALALRQPDPGPGDPDLGDAWGTWGGYLDWDTSSISESSARWACTLFLTGLSSVSVDNSPYAEITMDIAPRKSRVFNPAAGARMRWKVTDVATGVELQAAPTVAAADGVVVATGVIVPIDPARVRLAFFPCATDLDGDGETTESDLGALLANWGVTSGAVFENGDIDEDGDVDSSDLGALLAHFGIPCG